jgi:outer membrane beta-barrel protein
MKRLAISLATMAAVLALHGAAHVQAQDVEVKGPLAGAPAVIGLRIYREMRFQIQLQGSMTLTDEFSRTVLVGGQLMFHPTDWLGIGVWGGFGLANIDTGLTDQVVSKGQTNTVNVLSLPNPARFADQIGHIKWVAAPEVQFIPLRGKLGIFEKLFVDTDFYIFGGVGMVGLEERKNVDASFVGMCRSNARNMATGMENLSSEVACLQGTQTDRATRMAIAPTFGAGLSLYMTDFLAMTIEWRALPFAWNTSGTDESGDARGDFPDGAIDEKDRLSHFNHMISLGFAFYLPTTPKLSTAGTE